MHFHYYLNEEMWTSCDGIWRPRVELPILRHVSIHQYRKHSSRFRYHARKHVTRFLDPWVGKKITQNFVPASERDEAKTMKRFCNSCLVSSFFLDDCENSTIRDGPHFNKIYNIRNNAVEEPWLLHSSLIYNPASYVDNHGTRELDQSKINVDSSNEFEFNVNNKKNAYEPYDLSTIPVEEPWIFESSFSVGCSSAKMVSDASIIAVSKASTKYEKALPIVSDQHFLVPESPLHKDETTVSQEDHTSTAILINSSICTMQRIAILENDRLVELLLEPVKHNVQCDNVYLGLVTKLVPHMGGAFVNIGIPRPSFMDIKPHREPFILPPFHGNVKERVLKNSIFDKPEDLSHFPVNKIFYDETEVPDEEDDQSDNEFIDDDFERHQNHCIFDAFINDNMNGSVLGHVTEAETERFSDQVVGNVDKLRNRNILQYANNVNIVGSEESKWAHVQQGCKMIVQVVKEGLGTKGPTLTPYPVLRSRFWILITRCNTIGISKKISGSERTRLRVIAKTLQPSGFGLTVRTVASGHSMKALQKDLEGLLLTWENIMEHARSYALAADEGVEGAIPVMLHKSMGQTLSIVQDYFNEKVKSMVVDSPRTYHEVTNYLEKIDPNLCKRVELYRKKTPLFDEYKIEEEINNILSKRVPLTNGGYLVIEQTEALVSIDVNGGNCMLGQGTSQEIAILDVNLAAAKQIARELRLRDIGGIIVVDFIDMMVDSNKRLIYEEVKKAVEKDRSTVKVSELSRHGLMEITRKRVRPSVTFLISEPCSCCHASGRVEALETSFSKIEHEICRHLAIMEHKADPKSVKSWPRFILRVDRQMCNYLTSGKKTRLADLSSSLKVWILLKVARGLSRGIFELKPLTDNNLPKNQHQAAISVLRPSEAVTYPISKPKVTLFPIKWKTGAK